MRKSMRFFFTGFLLVSLFSFLPSGLFSVPRAHAQENEGASLFVGPGTGTFTVGSTFTVSLYLNTGGRYVNAIEAYLIFPPEKLQVVSPTSGKSLIEIWASPPTYSNKDGTLAFQGGVHKPGINAESGVVATITFRVKETGAGTIRLTDRSRVFLNDGTGTDVLSRTGGAVYSFILPPPAGPFVISPTHPDQTRWYSQNNAAFRWDIAPDAEGYSYTLSANPVEDPDNITEGKRGNISYENLPDGAHYFHIKALRAGVWGGTTHYELKIDSKPPAEFAIAVSPSARTSQQRPIITFDTTDVVSGIDHYELRIVRVDKSESSTTNDSNIPFFIEAVSPYSEELEFGRYHVIVKAYDRASNVMQASASLVITTAFLELLSGDGIWVAGKLLVPWGAVLTLCLALLIAVAYLLRRIIVLRRAVASQMRGGAADMPHIAETIKTLHEKQKEYHHSSSSLTVLLLFFLSVGVLVPHLAFGATSPLSDPTTVYPPLITLFPDTISNDEIPYVGGQSGAPNAEVILTLQHIEGGESFTRTVVTDKNGEWFYSFEQFLDPGTYQLWAQLKVGEALSVPSSRHALTVAPTALQIGRVRVSFERLYAILFLVFVIAFLVLLVMTLYHARHLKRQKARLTQEIREAEESIRRGFAVLRKDIQNELAVVHQMKASRELSLEEKLQEEKLLRDLEWASGYIGKEVWDIQKAEEGK